MDNKWTMTWLNDSLHGWHNTIFYHSLSRFTSGRGENPSTVINRKFSYGATRLATYVFKIISDWSNNDDKSTVHNLLKHDNGNNDINMITCSYNETYLNVRMWKYVKMYENIWKCMYVNMCGMHTNHDSLSIWWYTNIMDYESTVCRPVGFSLLIKWPLVLP